MILINPTTSAAFTGHRFIPYDKVSSLREVPYRNTTIEVSVHFITVVR